MIFMSNIKKEYKDLVLRAIEISGLPIEWRDEPDSHMDGCSDRHLYGSVWSHPSCVDTTAFWEAYDELKAERDCTLIDVTRKLDD